MPRGGRRRGTPGKAYTNRSDLNGNRQLPVQAPSGMPYGERKRVEDAQRAVPVAAPPAPSGAAPSPTRGAGGAAPTIVPLLAPTARPAEPITAGLAGGPGPGPEILPIARDTELDELRALYQRFPSEELRQAIEEAEDELGGW